MPACVIQYIHSLIQYVFSLFNVIQCVQLGVQMPKLSFDIGGVLALGPIPTPRPTTTSNHMPYETVIGILCNVQCGKIIVQTISLRHVCVMSGGGWCRTRSEPNLRTKSGSGAARQSRNHPGKSQFSNNVIIYISSSK